MEANWIDRFVGYFSPERGLDRTRARVRIGHIRSYAAATKGRRGDSWKKNATGLSSAAEVARAQPDLRNRSRELVRNNAYAARGIQVVQSNVVGKGIRPAITGTSNEDAIKKAWKDWAETTDCDFDGLHDYVGIQSLVMRSVVESGEVLVRKRRRRRKEGKISVQLQVLESDFLVTERTLTSRGIKPNGNNKIVQGIEFNEQGKRVAYHVWEIHPGNLGIDLSKVSTQFKTIRVPAEDMVHVYRVDRPGQLRGVPWITPAMLRLKDFDDYEQAQLLRQKLAACYMAFVKDTEISDMDDAEDDLVRKFEPGQIEFLPPGKDIVLSDPPQVNENYAEYTRVMLQAVATALGVSYEAMTGNLKDINFSSSRMGWLEFQRNIDMWRCLIMGVQFNDPTFNWFTDAVELEGLSTNGLNKIWIAPRREMIDPAKETDPLIDQLDAGIKTLAEIVQESGKNADDHFEALAKEQQMLDTMGITIQTKNRKNDSDVDSSENGGKVSKTTTDS